jgi:outer membrane translocation and assembly module TamA
MATGADLLWRPPAANRESFRFRAYVERQDSVGVETNFSLVHAFNSSWDFRPNVIADRIDEVGGELSLMPWWGSDPLAPQVGLELYGQGGAWRNPDSTALKGDYFRTSATLRVAIPLAAASWRVGLEAAAGTGWGEVPMQRSWFMGGPLSLRGYEASVLSGTSFTRGRLVVARTYPEAVTVSAFGDAAWAGAREDFDGGKLLYGAGLGFSLLDGLIRMDFSHGLKGPEKRFRFDLYLDAIL